MPSEDPAIQKKLLQILEKESAQEWDIAQLAAKTSESEADVERNLEELLGSGLVAKTGSSWSIAQGDDEGSPNGGKRRKVQDGEEEGEEGGEDGEENAEEDADAGEDEEIKTKKGATKRKTKGKKEPRSASGAAKKGGRGKKDDESEEAEEEAEAEEEGGEDGEDSDGGMPEEIDISEEFLKSAKVTLADVNKELAKLYGFAKEKGGLKKNMTKVKPLLIAIGNAITAIADEGRDPEQERQQQQQGTERVPKEKDIVKAICHLSKGGGEAPSVKKVREEIESKFKSLGKEKKAFSGWVKEVWTRLVNERHHWHYVSLFTRGKHSANKLRRLYRSIR